MELLVLRNIVAFHPLKVCWKYKDTASVKANLSSFLKTKKKIFIRRQERSNLPAETSDKSKFFVSTLIRTIKLHAPG
jgi:hypothetical protein